MNNELTERVIDGIKKIKISLDSFSGLAYLINNEAFISINQPFSEMTISLIHEVLHTLPGYSKTNFDCEKSQESKIENDALSLYFNSSQIKNLAEERIIRADWPKGYQMFLPFEPIDKTLNHKLY
jgi:predicted metal-dependent peptidase